MKSNVYDSSPSTRSNVYGSADSKLNSSSNSNSMNDSSTKLGGTYKTKIGNSNIDADELFEAAKDNAFGFPGQVQKGAMGGGVKNLKPPPGSVPPPSGGIHGGFNARTGSKNKTGNLPPGPGQPGPGMQQKQGDSFFNDDRAEYAKKKSNAQQKQKEKPIEYPKGFEKECKNVDTYLESERNKKTTEEKHKIFRTVCSRWHPDRPTGKTEVFQYLQSRKVWFIGE